MGIPKKPNIDAEEFIKSSKSDKINVENQLDNKKDKTFLLKLDYQLWKKLKEKSLEEDKTLHQYILDLLKKSIDQNWSLNIKFITILNYQFAQIWQDC